MCKNQYFIYLIVTFSSITHRVQLCFYSNNGYPHAPQYDVISTVPILFPHPTGTDWDSVTAWFCDSEIPWQWDLVTVRPHDSETHDNEILWRWDPMTDPVTVRPHDWDPVTVRPHDRDPVTMIPHDRSCDGETPWLRSCDDETPWLRSCDDETPWQILWRWDPMTEILWRWDPMTEILWRWDPVTVTPMTMRSCDSEILWRWDSVTVRPHDRSCDGQTPWQWDPWLRSCDGETPWLRSCDGETPWQWDPWQWDPVTMRPHDIETHENEILWRWDPLKLRFCNGEISWLWNPMTMKSYKCEILWRWDPITIRPRAVRPMTVRSNKGDILLERKRPACICDYILYTTWLTKPQTELHAGMSTLDYFMRLRMSATTPTDRTMCEKSERILLLPWRSADLSPW